MACAYLDGIVDVKPGLTPLRRAPPSAFEQCPPACRRVDALGVYGGRGRLTPIGRRITAR
jgi:hypothetical protein